MITIYGLKNYLLNYSKLRQNNVGPEKLDHIENEMSYYSNDIYDWTKKYC